VVWTIVQLPALPKQVHYRSYRPNVYGVNKDVQCGIVSSVVGGGQFCCDGERCAVWHLLCVVCGWWGAVLLRW